MWRLGSLAEAWQRSEAKHSAACRRYPSRRSESAERREKREKQNTCLYVCSIYPPFPIIVSIWETARKIMKQSFVNINSFTSQKKIVIFCFCFTKLEKKKTNRQRKVFKSLVICNYASKKATTNHTNTVKQNEQNTTNTSIFCFCLTALTCFFVGACEKNSCNSSRSSSATFMGFSFSCHWKKGCQRKKQYIAGFFHGLVSFSLRNFSAFTHDVYSHKNRLFQNVKKKNIKKETELYYSMPLCPL